MCRVQSVLLLAVLMTAGVANADGQNTDTVIAANAPVVMMTHQSFNVDDQDDWVGELLLCPLVPACDPPVNR